MLIVTLTADAFVNKGPGRPVFSEQMRAEMMAALDCVDYVAICADALAVPAIRKLKPHIYVKGQDYSRDEEDVTGGIVAERHAVEAHGGRVVFTDEMTFSSTTLINRHLGIFEPRLDQYLENPARSRHARQADRPGRSRPEHAGADGRRCDHRRLPLCHGDRQVAQGAHDRDPVPIARGVRWRRVFAAANHVADFCREVEVVTTIGFDGEYEKLIRNSPQAQCAPARLPAARQADDAKDPFHRSGLHCARCSRSTT